MPINCACVIWHMCSCVARLDAYYREVLNRDFARFVLPQSWVLVQIVRWAVGAYSLTWLTAITVLLMTAADRTIKCLTKPCTASWDFGTSSVFREPASFAAASLCFCPYIRFVVERNEWIHIGFKFHFCRVFPLHSVSYFNLFNELSDSCN